MWRSLRNRGLRLDIKGMMVILVYVRQLLKVDLAVRAAALDDFIIHLSNAILDGHSAEEAFESFPSTSPFSVNIFVPQTLHRIAMFGKNIIFRAVAAKLSEVASQLNTLLWEIEEAEQQEGYPDGHLTKLRRDFQETVEQQETLLDISKYELPEQEYIEDVPRLQRPTRQQKTYIEPDNSKWYNDAKLRHHMGYTEYRNKSGCSSGKNAQRVFAIIDGGWPDPSSDSDDNKYDDDLDPDNW